MDHHMDAPIQRPDNKGWVATKSISDIQARAHLADVARTIAAPMPLPAPV